MKKKEMPRMAYGLFILAGIFLISSCTAMILETSSQSIDGNVVQIPIKGVITGDGTGGLFESHGAVSSEIIKKINKVKETKKVKGVLFEINSPGGSAVASDEIAQAVKALELPTVAWIREVGASGAYWIASSADHVIANRMSVTGSIGVYGSYLEFPGLLGRFNISYNRLVSGKYKDLGVPYRELLPEEEELFQSKLDLLHDYFIGEVAANRGMEKEQVRELATGMFYLGSEALEIGLIDELGGKEEAMLYLEQKIGEKPHVFVYETQQGILDILANLVSHHGFQIGKGITSLVGEHGSVKIIT